VHLTLDMWIYDYVAWLDLFSSHLFWYLILYNWF
jgi:hypothetical protein